MGAGLESRVDRLEDSMVNVNQALLDIAQRLSRLEAKVDELQKDIDELKAYVVKRNGMMKWIVILLGMILSFVATMFGLGWRPPTH